MFVGVARLTLQIPDSGSLKSKRQVLRRVTERVKVRLQARETTIRYYTTRLHIFQNSIDMEADVPAQIEVATALDGRILSMVHKCSVPGCGCKREWHPDPDVVELLAGTYLAE